MTESKVVLVQTRIEGNGHFGLCKQEDKYEPLHFENLHLIFIVTFFEGGTMTSRKGVFKVMQTQLKGNFFDPVKSSNKGIRS